MPLENELSINLGLPQNPLTQNGELFTELKRVYNAINATARAVDSYTGVLGQPRDVWSELGVGQCSIGLNSKIYLEAAADLDYGNTIAIDSTGKAIKASGTNCIGFCTSSGGVLTGEYTEIQLLGIYPAFPAGTLTPGNKYYQSATAGSIGTSGSQVVGFAISDTVLFFNPQL